MIDNKSSYEKMIESLQNEGKIKTLSGEEHIELMYELSKGMVDFCHNNKRQQVKAQKEISELILNV